MKTFFHQWSVNGYVQKIQHGDWYGGKGKYLIIFHIINSQFSISYLISHSFSTGVGLCKISVDNQVINFYIAHVSCHDAKTIDKKFLILDHH